MNVIIVGLGVQGVKRKKILSGSKNFIGSVDPYSDNSDFKFLNQVPLDLYDSCFLCVPDSIKKELINFCIENKKNILVEKPLFFKNKNEFINIQKKANKNKVIIYTAYNHRFEPHIINLKKIVNSNKLGKIYSCKIFYGNGTARLVKNSKWRDKGLGVLGDLGPHLLDLCNYLFNTDKISFDIVYSGNNENKASDHVIINSKYKNIYINLEMTLCMWKNSFACEIIGEKGSVHVESLCKWGPSKLIYRKRIMPSGRPIEKTKLIKISDPTWNIEHKHFSNLIKKNVKTNLTKDLWIFKNLMKLKNKI